MVKNKSATHKEKVQSVLDYFADKTLSFGLVVQTRGIRPTKQRVRAVAKDGNIYFGHQKMHPDQVKIIGHPVIIGDVLEKIQIPVTVQSCRRFGNMFQLPWKIGQTVWLWWKCGFTKSLNDIFSGHELLRSELAVKKDYLTTDPYEVVQFKDPNAQNLLEFLYNLVPTE
mgnify:CR=1 FL=1